MEQPSNNRQTLDWRRVAPLLASAHTRGGSGKKLRIRVLDTVFLGGNSGSDARSNSNSRRGLPPVSRRTPYHRSGYASSSSSTSQPVIAEWVYTSKKGEVTMRKGAAGASGGGGSGSGVSSSSFSSSLWSHVCDRFGRIALSSNGNSAGPRIVAVGRGRSFDVVRCHLTAEQLKRDICGCSASSGNGSLLSANKCQAIQCYVRPQGGDDRIFRAIYTLDGSRNNEPSVEVVMVEDGSTLGASCASVVPLDERMMQRQQVDLCQVKKEVQMTTIDVVTHIESVLNGLQKEKERLNHQDPLKVTSVTLDFVWDDQDQLWLSHTDRMCISDGRKEREDNTGGTGDGYGGEAHDNVGSSSDRCAASSSSLGPLLDNHTEHTPIIDGGDFAAGGGGMQVARSTAAEMNFVGNGLDDLLPSPHDDGAQQVEDLLASAEQEKVQAQEEAQLLQERIDELESELENVRMRLDTSSQVALDSNDKVQALNLKLAKLRKQMTLELQTKDDDHARIVLDLESQVNAKRAEVARLQAAAAASCSSTSSGGGGGGTSGDIHTGTANNAASEFLEQDLLAKIDSLHNELMMAKRNWGQERRSLASSHAAAEQERAAKHRRELAEQRATISSLEDDVVAQKEKTRDAEKESIVLLQKLAAANHRADEAQNDATNLRDELDLVKQSLEQASRQSNGGSNTSANNNALAPSTTTAAAAYEEADNKIRTLNNKVEYLKAQLQSEVSVKEEYKSTLATLRKEKEILVDAHRCRLNELEARKEQQILHVQEQLRVAMKRPSEDDVANLQEEIKVLQIQVEEAKQASAEARQCEQDAQAQAAKEQSLAERAKQELEAARNETIAANREIDRLKDANLDAAANEGVLRRLDNERRYLKNQLHLEIASKAELLKKVEESDQWIKMVKDAGKHESRSLSLELKKEKHSRTVMESQLRDSNQILEAEVKVQKNQIEELRQAYAATRDQLRMEQASAEQIRASGQRMAEELKAAQDELKYLRIVADDDAARHNETTRAISDSLKKADDMRTQEVCRLQEEMQHALQKASDTQRDMLNLRAKMRSEQVQAAKTFAAHHLTVLFAQRLRFEKQRAFSTWQLQSAVVQAQRAVSNKLSSSTEEATERARKECAKEWQRRLENAQEESASRSKEAETKMMQERMRIVEQAKADQEKAVSEERLRLEAVMHEKEISWIQKEKDIHSSHQSAIAKLARENNENLEGVQTKAQKRIDEAKSDAAIALEERKQIILQDCNRQWESKLADIRTDLEREKQDALADAAQHHCRILQQEQGKFAAREAEIRVEMTSATELAVAKETERMEQIHCKAIEENDNIWSKRLEEAQTLNMADREAIEEQHQEQLSKTMAALEYSRQERERDLKADLERRHAVALEEAQTSDQQRIDEAIEREAQSWEQRMRELQAKMEVECRQQYDQGKADGNVRARKEIEDAKTAAEEMVAKARKEAEARIARALEAKTIEVEQTLLKVKAEQEEAVTKALQQAKADHERQAEEAAQQSKAVLECEQKRLSLLAEQETERALAEATTEHEAITKALRANLEASELLRSKEKESFATQLDEVKSSAEDSTKKRLADLERQTREHYTMEREKAQRDFDRQRREWNEAHRLDLEKAESAAADRSNTAILKVQEEAKEAMRAALDKVVTTHEEQEAELRAEAKLMMDERDSALQDIALLQSEIANQQSAIEEAQEELDAAQKSSALRLLRLATSSMLQQNDLKKALESSQDEFNRTLQTIQEEATATQEDLEQQVMDMEIIIKSYQTQRKQVQDVLVSHNRDALLRQKAKSREVLSQLDAIGTERQTLQDKRRAAEEERNSLENQIRELEAKIQQHSQTSSLQGGRINIAHARKKRSLDEAYDVLLDKLETNREDISSIDEELKDVQDRKEVQEERRKETERALVEILLGQTKKVMKILNASQT